MLSSKRNIFFPAWSLGTKRRESCPRQSKKLRRGGVAEPFGHDERLKKYKLRQYAREPTTRDNSVGLGYLTCSQQLSDRGAQPQYVALPAENLRSTLVNTPGVPEEQQISDSLITVDEWLRERIGMSLQVTWTFAIKRDSGEIVYRCIVITNITKRNFIVKFLSIIDIDVGFAYRMRQIRKFFLRSARPEHYYQELTENEDNEYNVQRAVTQINEL
ncbi:hypothetical protein ALC57_06011 [Trachymyrmex cornetzi]|uniref:Uncharacterized protein n=1 Tax=Trachymyrmex cornetzi TaxID=471704 RepID=A0A151J991_9HYME|nr:hypothetical protein ALC57_06011 [Trachymyrmex cornetzi]